MNLMKLYTSKAVTIAAVRFLEEAITHLDGDGGDVFRFDVTDEDAVIGTVISESPVLKDDRGTYLEIETLEGVMRADLGDWIIRGLKGEYYPCKDEVFQLKYVEGLPAPTPPPKEEEAPANPSTHPNGFPEGSFSWALVELKKGFVVRRKGWNGKDMFLYLVKPGRYKPSTPAGQFIAGQEEDGLVPYGPYIAMKTAQGNVVPWLASQTDVLSGDWALVELGVSSEA